MAFTGDLELLNIVDIIQLLSSTRKSGTFSVMGSKGESQIIFSNGYIVGASHLNNRFRIGTVLVKMNAITPEDLEQALEVQKAAGKERKPLIVTLMEMGKLGRDQAARGLKKLIEMTIIELISWTKGTFTLDTEAIAVSPECSYPISKMEQEVGLDAQMILMDAVRMLDERERDRQSGKTVPSDEEVFADVLSSEASEGALEKSQLITADDLGLGDLERLERKIPQYVPVNEVFDPSEIHRRKIKETLAAFPAEEQEAFVSFLERSAAGEAALEGPHGKEGRSEALVLFSEDELIKHSVMTICKDLGVLVFATDGEEELDHIIGQCLKIKALPVLVLDTPETPERLLTRDKIVSLHLQMRERYPQVSIFQMASPPDYLFTLQSFRDGVRAVLPKPSREAGKETFIADTIAFLETLKSYISGFFLEQKDLISEQKNVGGQQDLGEQKDLSPTDDRLSVLKDRIVSLRQLDEPAAVSLALLQSVAELCERSVTFIVRSSELVGERALGVYAEKDAGPTSVAFKIPLTEPSVFRDVIEGGKFFCGESEDEVLKKHLFEQIGAPLRPFIVLLPMRSCGKVLILTYGDFGGKEAQPLQGDLLEVLAQSAGLVVESVLYRKQFNKVSPK
ncbi:MAG TPA: DUF4388 domain-containing protein [Thermodesulfovibrionales bacterium]|nr:DUF4388 domain-containing protein [Thermodesulfovibrionales bacterium]